MAEDAAHTRIIRPASGAEGYEAHAQLTSTALSDTVNLPVNERPIIPIVFLPGIMGSNLYNTNSNEPVWIPDNKALTFYNFFPSFNSTCQEHLDATSTEVYNEGEIETSVQESEDILRNRGWGEIYSSAYHPFMHIMQDVLNSVMKRGTIDKKWKELCKLPLGRYGMSSSMSPLTEDELKTLAKFRFEVWACGYNWLRSNEESANHVAEFITSKLLPHYKKNPHVRLAAEKVILVTHSMGGLVARSLCLKNKDLVLGVLHGAQPSNGAAESYTNLRQGVSGMLGLVLGTNSAALGAVYTQCQGGLELLPFGCSRSYNPRPMRLAPPQCLSQDTTPGVWLFVNTPHEGGLMECSSAENVYDQIYKSPAWYGLLPKHNEHHFDPAGIQKKLHLRKSTREIFGKFIDKVKEFHESVVSKYHPVTYAFWGAGKDTSAAGEALWDGVRRFIGEYTRSRQSNRPVRDSGRGSCAADGNHYTLRIIKTPGDGTVPRASWQADLGRPDIQGYCCLGVSKEDPAGFGHQDAYNDSRARDVSLYFLAKLVSRQAGELKP